jgi:hypothetical protein
LGAEKEAPGLVHCSPMKSKNIQHSTLNFQGTDFNIQRLAKSGSSSSGAAAASLKTIIE